MEIEIIFGPPGTGKTTRLLEVLENELKTHAINEIAYVSYTKEGVNQGKQRAKARLNCTLADMMYFRTLHSIAFRSNNLRPSMVISKKDYKTFSSSMGMNFTGYYSEEYSHADDIYLYYETLQRNNPKTAGDYLYLIDTQKMAYVKNNYKHFKHILGKVDYTDMLDMFIKKNESTPVKIAIIDEAQDLTTLQWQMVWVAFRNCEKVYIAGDDDQAIYEWMGADVNYFLKIDGNTEILKKSYRLPESILQYSKNITRMITNRVTKDYHGAYSGGDIAHIYKLSELNLNLKESYLFLSRNHKFLNEAETYLKSKGIIYKTKNGLSAKKADASLISLYEQARQRRSMDMITEAKLLPHLKQPVDITIPWYDSFNWAYDKILYYRDIVRHNKNLVESNIRVSTIHAVKGAEADNVILFLDVTPKVSKNMDKNPDSEHRVFYVGVTRAREKLYVVHGHTNRQYKIYEEAINE